MMERNEYFTTIQAAILAGRPDFAKRLLGDWHEHWPGDIEAWLMLARAEIAMSSYENAVVVLQGIIETDPEVAEAYQLLAEICPNVGQPQRVTMYTALAMLLNGDDLSGDNTPIWVEHLN